MNFIFTLTATLFVTAFSMDLMTNSNSPMLIKSVAWFFPFSMILYTLYCGFAFFLKDE